MTQMAVAASSLDRLATELHEFESQYEGDDFYDEFFEPYAELFPGTGHRLGGYPFFTQSDPREYNYKIHRICSHPQPLLLQQ